MTDLDLDAIEARANAATPGPWEVVRDNDGFEGGVELFTYYYIVFGESGPGLTELGYDDMQFIAHARFDAPALVAEVRRLRAVLAQQAQPLTDAQIEAIESMLRIQGHSLAYIDGYLMCLRDRVDKQANVKNCEMWHDKG